MGIFGSRETRPVGAGEFHCPACHEDREYELVITVERRAFLGVPVGDEREKERRVTCRSCGTRFGPDILFEDEERYAHRVEAALRQGLRGLVVRMVLEDGRVEESERAVLSRVHEELLGRPLDADDLDAEIRAAEEDPRPTGEFARDIAPFLDDHEKKIVLGAAMRVALADQDYDPSERRLLAEIGAGLEMAPEAIRSVLARGQALPEPEPEAEPEPEPE